MCVFGPVDGKEGRFLSNHVALVQDSNVVIIGWRTSENVMSKSILIKHILSGNPRVIVWVVLCPPHAALHIAGDELVDLSDTFGVGGLVCRDALGRDADAVLPPVGQVETALRASRGAVGPQLKDGVVLAHLLQTLIGKKVSRIVPHPRNKFQEAVD